MTTLPEVGLRLARDDEWEWLFELHTGAFRPCAEESSGLSDPVEQRAGVRAIDPRNVVGVVSEAGRPVGALHWRVDEEGGLFIDLLEVSPDRQGRGIATAVLGLVRERAGRQPVRLSVQRANRARRLYERLGFVAVGGDDRRLVMSLEGRAAPAGPVATRYPGALVGELADSARRVRRPAGLARTVIAVDGCGGAGKSTLASELSDALGEVPVVHTDDFASPDEPFEGWPRLLEEVLQPACAGKRVRYRRYDWVAGCLGETVVVPEHDMVLLEGVGSSRLAFRNHLSLAIWVDCPPMVRLQRGMARDGAAALSRWRD